MNKKAGFKLLKYILGCIFAVAIGFVGLLLGDYAATDTTMPFIMKIPLYIAKMVGGLSVYLGGGLLISIGGFAVFLIIVVLPLFVLTTCAEKIKSFVQKKLGRNKDK